MGKKFTSHYQPSPEAKSAGHERKKEVEPLPKPIVDFIKKYRGDLMGTALDDDFILDFALDIRSASIADRLSFLRYMIPPVELPKEEHRDLSSVEEACAIIANEHKSNGKDYDEG